MTGPFETESPAGSLPVGDGPNRLVLLPTGAAFSPGEQALFVADCHLGKAAHLRSGGLALPDGETVQDLGNLSRDLRATHARRLIVLGDLFHGQASLADPVRAAIDVWRCDWPGLDWCLVPGNHDRCLAELPASWNLGILPAGMDLGPFRLVHAPLAEASVARLTLSGHLHPAIRLRERGAASRSGGLRVPVFWYQRNLHQWVLPAYGSFTGTAVIQPRTGDTTCLLGGGRVVRMKG
ncbi:MAG: ligase-associated DNA damage response endonuclease PdeM [Opitutales bacterium]